MRLWNTPPGATGALALCALLVLAGGVEATTTAVTVNNMTARTFAVTDRGLGEGDWGAPAAGMVTSLGRITWSAVSTGLMHGNQGWVSLGSLDGKSWTRIQWDNPFIGSNDYRADSSQDIAVTQTTGGQGSDASVTFDIRGRGPEYTVLDVPQSGPGAISGAVRWRAAEGVPALISQPWGAFSIQAVAPRVFNAVFTAGTPPPPAANQTQWQGQQGYFAQVAPTGQLACRPPSVLSPGYYGFDYTVSNLPTSAPIQLEVKILDSVSWPPDPSNAPPPGLLSPKYARGVIPAVGIAFTIWPDRTSLTGVDFTVAGVWGSDPPGGGGQGSVAGDAAALVARSKSFAVNPNPVMGLRLLRPGMASQRMDVLRQPNNPRVLTNPRILTNPQVQVQPAAPRLLPH